MTEPAETTKRTRLDDARDVLHGALVRTMAACGWPAERAHRLPPRQVVAPMGWVDAPTLSQGNTSGVSTVMATFPVAVTVDGADQQQVQQLDRLLAHGYAELDQVKLPSDRPGADGPVCRVLTAGPQFLDVGGVETRAVVFSVQLTLQVRTLCSGAVTASDEAPTAP